MKQPYEDIIRMERPVSRHPGMSRQDRAKIFSPFAALRGHEEAVAAMEEVRCNKLILAGYELERINESLRKIKKRDVVSITYFYYNPGPDGCGGEAEGEYRRIEGIVLMMDPARQRLRIEDSRTETGWIEIRWSDLLNIETKDE